MPRFHRSHDPDRPGQLLLQDGEPVAIVYWAHDFAERDQTGWFLAILDDDGEPDGAPPQRLEVSGDVAALVADDRLDAARAGSRRPRRSSSSPPPRRSTRASAGSSSCSAATAPERSRADIGSPPRRRCR